MFSADAIIGGLYSRTAIPAFNDFYSNSIHRVHRPLTLYLQVKNTDDNQFGEHVRSRSFLRDSRSAFLTFSAFVFLRV